MKRLFSVLDINKSERLDKAGFRSLLRGCNVEMSDRDFDSFFEMNQDGGFVNYSTLRRHIQSNSNYADDPSFAAESSGEDARMMMRLGEIRTASNPYMNAYNHSRPQNISRVEGSFTEDSPSFATSVFRTGHFVRPLPQEDPVQEASVVSANVDYDFRTQVHFVHKHLLLRSSMPLQEQTLQALIAGFQQELRQVAELRHSFVYQVSDTTQEYKCILQLLWQPVASFRGQAEQYLSREGWKRLCERTARSVRVECVWMVDVNPDSFKEKIALYHCGVCLQMGDGHLYMGSGNGFCEVVNLTKPPINSLNDST